MFDMGPYYLTALVSLMGPISRVAGSARATFPERTIESAQRKVMMDLVDRVVIGKMPAAASVAAAAAEEQKLLDAAR